MSIESYKHGVLTLTCNECPESGEFEGDTFEDAMAEAHSQGWISVAIGPNEWIHFDEESCRNKYFRKRKSPRLFSQSN